MKGKGEPSKDKAGKAARGAAPRKRAADAPPHGTELKQVEEALRASKERARALIESAPDAIFVRDSVGTLIDVNARVEALIGYSRDELIGRNFIEMGVLTEESIARTLKIVGEGTPEGLEKPRELELIAKDGSQVLVEITSYPVAGTENAEFIGIAREITGRKKLEVDQEQLQQALEEQNEAMGELYLGLEDKEEELKDVDERYRLLAENVTDVIWTMDTDLRFTFISPSVTRQRGFSVEEAMALTREESLTPASLEAAMEAIGKAQARLSGEQKPLQDVSWSMELEAYCKDGSTIWVETKSTFVHDSDGKPAGVVGVTRDITDRKLVEGELRQSEEYHRSLLENSMEAIAIVDRDGTVQYESPSYQRVLGRNPEDQVGVSSWDRVHPDDLPNVAKIFEEMFRNPGDTVRAEVRSLHEDGSYRTLEVVGKNLLDDPIVHGIVANFRDITDRKQAEDALHESERRLTEAQRVGNVGDWQFDVDTRQISWSEEVYRLFERDPAQGPPTYEENMAYYYPEDSERLQEHVRRATESGEESDCDYQLNLPGGRTVFQRGIIRVRKDDDGRVTKLFGIVQDVTERKLAEEALREKERYLKEAQAIARVGYWKLDCETQEVVGSDELLNIFDLRSDQLTLEAFAAVVHPDDREYDLRHIRRGIEYGEPWDIEHRLICQNGVEKWVHAIGEPIADEAGKTVMLMGTVQDITERKRSAEAVQSSDRMFRRLAEDMSDGYCVLQGARIVFANSRVAEMFGYTPDEVTGKGIHELLPPEVIAGLAEKSEQRRLGYASQQYEVTLVSKDGTAHQVEFGTSTTEYDGEPALSVLIRDITERKQAQALVREAKERYERLTDNADEAIFRVDAAGGHVVYVNAAAERIFGYSRAEWLGDPTLGFRIIHPDSLEKQRQIIEEIHTSGRTMKSTILTWIAKDGREVIMEYTIIPVIDEHGELVYFESIGRDITQRRQAEREKELQLKVLARQNQGGDLKDMIRDLLLFLQEFSGCEAAGIRLGEDGDFPYYETAGFPAHFVESERSLCSRDAIGEVVRDDRGNPVLECMCGNIVCGRTDPQKPFFTEGGSFWTNSTTELLASTSEADRQGRTRNRCNGEGYESVALVPLAVESRNVGLLQLNDRRQGMFTIEVIEFYEGIAQSIGMMLARRQAEEEQRKLTHDLGERVKEQTCLYGVSTIAGNTDISVEEMLDGIVALIPPGWQYPEITCGRIIIWGQEFKTGNFADSEWKQSSSILVHGEVVGVLEVCYLEEKQELDEGPFLKEERNLINAIGEQVGKTIERRQAEEALRDKEEYFRSLIENSTDGIMVLNGDGTIRYQSPSAGSMMGRVSEDQIDTNPFELVHPDDIARATEVYEKLLQEPGATAQAEMRFQHADGSWRLLESISRNLLENPAVAGIVVNYRDITERRQAEDAVRNSEQKHRTLFETMAQGVVYQSANGEIASANRAAERILGLTLDQMQGRTSTDPRWKAIHEDGSDFPGEMHPAMVALQTGKPVTDVVMGVFNPQTNEYRWMNIDSVPQFSPGEDEPCQVYTTFEDVTERRQAEEAVRESERHFRALTENSLDTITVLGGDGTIRYRSPSYYHVLGYDPEDGLGGGLLEHIHPDDAAYVSEAFAQMLQTPGGTLSAQIRAQHKDGSWRHIEAIGKNLLDDPAVLGIIVNLRDITERKQAEDAARLAHTELDQIFNSAASALRLVDRDFNILKANESFYALAGIAADEAHGKKCYEVFPGPACHTDRCTLARIMRGEEHVEYDEEKQRSDGSKVQCLLVATPYTGPDGELIGMVQSFIDITERKQAEKAVRESEQRYRLLAENVTDVIWTMDMDLRYTYVSPSVELLRGFGSDEATAHTLEETLSPASIETALGVIVERMKQKDFSRLAVMELEMRRKDGSTVWTETRASFLLAGDGEPTGILGITRDISERRRVEEERRKMEQQIQLTGRLAAVGELAAGVAHELNNPLAAVQGFAQLLADRKDLDETMRSDIDTIHKEAKRASKITSNLLSFARKHEPEKRLISINDAVAQSTDLHAYRMRVNNVDISTDLDPDLPATMADSHQLQQVFVNLITNAEQAMTEAHGKGTLSIRTEAVGKVIRIIFSDDGPGIPEENLTSIFDPFFTTKAVGKGTGLGLSICFGIVQQHGGHLHATSEPGKGATFIVEIPIVSEGQAVLDSSGLDQTGATCD